MSKYPKPSALELRLFDEARQRGEITDAICLCHCGTCEGGRMGKVFDAYGRLGHCWNQPCERTRKLVKFHES